MNCDVEDLTHLRERLKTIVSSWQPTFVDSKYEAFRASLRQSREIFENRKVLVFAFFKGTLRYLERRLREDGFNVALITGDVRPDERTGKVEEFREAKGFGVLLMSRVGSEGLDFQFADTIINYDLPWNPMEIEQRIGRIDRIGQESDIINVINLWVKGSIEERILKKLFERIGIFERSVGDLETILGEELHELESLVLSRELTAEQEANQVEMAARAIESRLNMLKTLEDKDSQFIGADQFFQEEIRRLRLQRKHVTGTQLHAFLEDYIRERCPNTKLEYDGQTSVGTITPDKDLKSQIGKSRFAKDLRKFSRGGEAGIAITFESDVAFRNQRLEFINVLHPFVRFIIDSYHETPPSLVDAFQIRLQTNTLPPGDYFFFIYRILVEAARPRNSLEMVLLDDRLRPPCGQEAAALVLGEMLEFGTSPRVSIGIAPEAASAASQVATDIATAHLVSIRHQIESTNDSFVQIRQDSLRSYYDKKIQNKEEALRKATFERRDDRYIRMLQGTIRNLNSDKSEALKTLEDHRTISIEYSDLACGLLEVKTTHS
jgi:hypothetical protein